MILIDTYDYKSSMQRYKWQWWLHLHQQSQQGLLTLLLASLSFTCLKNHFEIKKNIHPQLCPIEQFCSNACKENLSNTTFSEVQGGEPLEFCCSLVSTSIETITFVNILAVVRVTTSPGGRWQRNGCLQETALHTLISTFTLILHTHFNFHFLLAHVYF